jgi:glycosyltransferase involved in cell wall biosynthesis
MKVIAIDAQSLTTQPTGIGHYLMAAVNVWSELDKAITFLLLAHKKLHPQAELYLRKAPNIQFIVCPAPVLPSNGLWWMLTSFAFHAKRLNATHIWGASGVLPIWGCAGLIKILTVHDLVYKSLPWTMSLKSRIAYGVLAGRSICTSDIIWSVSKFTSSEIDKYYPVIKARQRVIGSGLNPIRTANVLDKDFIHSVIEQYHIDDKTLLFVGTLEPRKNLGFLLSLMPILAKAGVRLLVVGCSGWGKSDLANIVQDQEFPLNSVCFCSYVSDDELQAMYLSVSFFISTSLMEGFGLPHLEAMSVGCPVIAAANSAVVEVVGEGGVLIEGWDVNEWCNKINEGILLRGEYSQRALISAQRYLMSEVCTAVMNVPTFEVS